MSCYFRLCRFFLFVIKQQFYSSGQGADLKILKGHFLFNTVHNELHYIFHAHIRVYVHICMCISVRLCVCVCM